MIREGVSGGGYLLTHAGLQIPFQLVQSPRAKLTINVYPNLSVEVLAPSTATTEEILARVQRRAPWIVRQWRYFEQFQPSQPSRRYVGGETHLYLGRQYRLKVSTSSEGSVKLIGRFFHVGVPDAGDTTSISEMLMKWYDVHARNLFEMRLRNLIEGSRALSDLQPPRLLVRQMKRRWGSCSKRGTITLNVDLVKAPLAYIDYVIVHELCHLKIHRHDESFYRLLDRCMPDWRRRKERLDWFAL